MTHTAETQVPDASALIQAVEQADSPVRLTAAVQALAAARLAGGIPTLIEALGYNNPAAAVAAVEGLIQLGSVAVEPLLERIDGYNYGARAYSFRALAAIADPRAFDVLLNAATTDFAPSVRRAAAKGLGQLRWGDLPPEQRHSAQRQAFEALTLLSQDDEWAIRYAAVAGLAGLAAAGQRLTPTSPLVDPVLERLAHLADTDPDAVIRARVALAQEQLRLSHSS